MSKSEIVIVALRLGAIYLAFLTIGDVGNLISVVFAAVSLSQQWGGQIAWWENPNMGFVLGTIVTMVLRGAVAWLLWSRAPRLADWIIGAPLATPLTGELPTHDQPETRAQQKSRPLNGEHWKSLGGLLLGLYFVGAVIPTVGNLVRLLIGIWGRFNDFSYASETVFRDFDGTVTTAILQLLVGIGLLILSRRWAKRAAAMDSATDSATPGAADTASNLASGGE